MLGKTVKFIENLAVENKAVVVIGDINEKSEKRMEEDANSKLRHRIHQWSVKRLIELLDEKPIHVVKVSERGLHLETHSRARGLGGLSPW